MHADLTLRDDRALRCSERTLVMGILNITPDSFSDGGQFADAAAAVEHALALEAAGADLIDLGGESSRPGADPVPEEEQRRRVLPVIEGIRRQSQVPLSIDTTRAPVARGALDAGADLVNDISALRDDPDMPGLVAAAECPVVLMHMQGTPRSMQDAPNYKDVVVEVIDFLVERRLAAKSAGIAADRIILDPGIGFGKTAEHNLALLANLYRLVDLGSPILVGASRKATIGQVLDAPVGDRLEGSLAVAVMVTMLGASFVRVHDVAETVRAVRMTEAVLAARTPGSHHGE